MKTMRQELTELGFDWNNGIIVIQYHIDGLAENGEPKKISNSDTVCKETAAVYSLVWPQDNINEFLDIEYMDPKSTTTNHDGDIPVFIAEDLNRVYFSTIDREYYHGWIEVIEKDRRKYYTDPNKHRITFY